MKKRITQDDYIKANRKASREEEIESHGHPVSYKRVHQSKKVYNRRKRKAEDKALPFFVPGSHAKIKRTASIHMRSGSFQLIEKPTISSPDSGNNCHHPQALL